MELKLRGWYKKGFGEIMIEALTPNTWHRKIPSNAEDCMILMLPVGSKDKNGKEVYQSDIVKAPSGNLFVIKYKEDELAWKMQSLDGYWFNTNFALLEVVGNIHENPELLQIIK